MENNRGAFNEYDLQAVSAYKAKNCKVFWMVTASFVSKVMCNASAQLYELPQKIFPVRAKRSTHAWDPSSRETEAGGL